MKYRRTRKQRGGEVHIKFPKPLISETSVGSAIKGSIQAQKANNDEMSEMNKQVGGGDVTVPQFDQAGDSGNTSISGGIGNILKGAADSEFDGDIETSSSANSDYIGGKRKTRRRKRKCCKCKRCVKKCPCKKKGKCLKKCKCRKNFLNKRSRKTRKRKLNKRSRKTRKRRKTRRTRNRKKTRRRRRKGGYQKLTPEDVRFNSKNKKLPSKQKVISDAMIENIKRREDKIKHKKEAEELGVADFVTIG